LARRARARGGGERRRSARAARRGLRRDRKGKASPRFLARLPESGVVAKLRSTSRLAQQTFLKKHRLRDVLILLAAIWVLWTFGLSEAGLPKLVAVQRQNAQLRVEIEELEAQEDALRVQVEALKDKKNTQAVEQAARDEHAMVKDGEVLVRFHEVGEGEKERGRQERQ
jgi:cell division protein FtsB